MTKEMRRHGVKQSQLGAAFAGPPTQSPATSNRCRETHDVPFTLRCTLDANHVTKVIREEMIQSGEWAGAIVRSFQPHVDKDGRQW